MSDLTHIYKITHLISGKAYIGVSNDPDRRFKEHCSAKTTLVGRAIRKYGKENFDFRVICSAREELAYFYEQPFIAGHDTMAPNGYNLKFGGTGGRHTDETKAKISAAHMGKILTQEHIAKMSAAMTGRVKSDETIAKMSAAMMGHAVSDETKAKLSAAHMGKVLTEEHRAKMSAANMGKTLSEDHRAKMSASQKGRVKTDETRAKISAAKMGHAVSDETKAKISAALIAKNKGADK